MAIWKVTPFTPIQIAAGGAKVGRPTLGTVAMSSTARSQRARKIKTDARIEKVAILDFETDPFDAVRKSAVYPFLGGLYADDFAPVIIWDDDSKRFTDKIIAAIEGLEGSYTIYAHNGGKFDYLFLLHRLRGHVAFKGRGLMSARIGNHELRDSFHIIPEKLANWQKDDFDYTRMERANRAKYKQEIIDYCVNDCKYLLQIVKAFLKEFGFKISIGQAAMYELKKHYRVKSLGENMDAFLRQWFFGGRVECLVGKGHFSEGSTAGDYKLYDVNSMYPYVMANYRHPVGNDFTVRSGKPGPNTFFLEIECENHGAFVGRGEFGDTDSAIERGTFKTSIYEYNVAIKYNLIRKAKILRCIDCAEGSSFADFVMPLYNRREETKKLLKSLEEGSFEYNEAKKDNIFLKLIMNNAYGKFAQNPRRFKEAYITGKEDRPPEDLGFPALPSVEAEEYCIWEKPNEKWRFNNVATAASITGAARSLLLEAIMNADDPIYCDTDSVICRNLSGVDIDPIRLGAWDIEKVIDEVIICGKKLYAYKIHGQPDKLANGKVNPKRFIYKSKGASGLTWKDYVNMLDNQIAEALRVITVTNPAPTFTKGQKQFYMARRIRATAPANNIHSKYRKHSEKVLNHA